METETPTYKVMVCRDCVDAVEFSDDDLGYPDGTMLAHQRRMKSHRPDLGLTWNPIIALGEESDVAFSTSPCDTCGSQFAGERYGYEVIETQPDPDHRRCPKCRQHPGWATGDESKRRDPADICRACLGSGRIQG